MDDAKWPPSLDEWTAHDGTVWARGTPRWLGESDAARLQLRDTTLVAHEVQGFGEDLVWLSPADRRVFWKEKVAGHLDVANGVEVDHNTDGVVFRASVWTDQAGRRLILLSRFR
jgi:hypothetical protein